MDWRDAFQTPFSWGGINVLSKNYTTALTFSFDYFLLTEQKQNFIVNVVNKLNGDTTIKFDSKFSIQNGIEFYYEGKYVFCIRGWGKLTGVGGYNLPSDEAIKIQNDFAYWVLETLNS